MNILSKWLLLLLPFVKHELKGSVEVYGQKFGPTTPPPHTDVTDIVLNDPIGVPVSVVKASQT